jgi:CRP-like cAMP-binding protein
MQTADAGDDTYEFGGCKNFAAAEKPGRLFGDSSFSVTHLKKLAANLSVKTAAKNEIVFDQGDDANRVYLLLSGAGARVNG